MLFCKKKNMYVYVLNKVAAQRKESNKKCTQAASDAQLTAACADLEEEKYVCVRAHDGSHSAQRSKGEVCPDNCV